MQVWITYFKSKYCFINLCFSHVCLFVSVCVVCMCVCVCVCVWFYWVIIQNKRQNIFLSVHHGQKHLKNLALPKAVPFFCSVSNWKVLLPETSTSTETFLPVVSFLEHWGWTLARFRACLSLCWWTNRSRCAYYVSLPCSNPIISSHRRRPVKMFAKGQSLFSVYNINFH